MRPSFQGKAHARPNNNPTAKGTRCAPSERLKRMKAYSLASCKFQFWLLVQQPRQINA